jgi:hypothetical protein
MSASSFKVARSASRARGTYTVEVGAEGNRVTDVRWHVYIHAHYRIGRLFRWLTAVGKGKIAIGEGFADGNLT